MHVGVTGATGVVGGRVARLLAEQGVEQRLLVRDPARAPELPGAMVAQAEYGDSSTTRAALDGISTLFMVSGAESATRREEHLAFVDDVAAAGVEHVVYLSFFGAAEDCTFTLGRDHFATEEAVRASGMRWTFLRDNFYADYLRLFAGEDHVLRGPAGDGRAAFVAQRDVADAVAAVLLDPEAHLDATYDLTGPASLSMAEAAELMSEVLGTPYTYEAETLEQAWASRASYGAPDWQVEAWVSTYTAIAAGELDGPTDAVLRLTGHEPTPVAEVLAEGRPA